ncbi:MAG: cation:proton antiporter [Lachnospirales bacterium]
MERVFLDIAIILIFTKCFGLMTKRVHLPQVVGALIAGIVLGPSLLGIVPQSDEIILLSEMGVIILLFNAGLETDISVMKRSLKAYLIIGVIEVVFSLIVGFIFAKFFAMDLMHSIFIGVLLTATSLGITVEALSEMGKIKTVAGLSILGIAVVDDILGIIVLTLALNLGSGSSLSPMAFCLIIGKIMLFFIFAFVAGIIVNKIFEKIYAVSGNKHRLSILAIAFCFAMAWAAEWFGLADITGAYLAGLALSKTRSSKYVEGKSSILSYVLFSPIFFASIGLKTDLHQLTSSILIFAVLYIVIACFTKVVGNYVGARMVKFASMDALLIGIGMMSRGEVTLIMANKGLDAGILSSEYFPAIIIMVIGTTLITPLLLTYFFKIKDRHDEATLVREVKK